MRLPNYFLTLTSLNTAEVLPDELSNLLLAAAVLLDALKVLHLKSKVYLLVLSG